MTKWYALEVAKTDLPLLRFLNDGSFPKTPTGKYYLVFGVSRDGKEITTQILTKSEMFKRYDMANTSPFLIALKEI
jgi:hypothetical protein